MPGTPSSRGLSVQSANVRSSIRERARDVSPMTRTRLAADVGGTIAGAWTPCGSCPARVASRSPTSWRACRIPVPSRKVAVTTESPWIDSDRIDSRLPTPFTAASIGRVTSASTSSGESPDASVWMTTWGGANSGKTSRLAVEAA